MRGTALWGVRALCEAIAEYGCLCSPQYTTPHALLNIKAQGHISIIMLGWRIVMPCPQT